MTTITTRRTIRVLLLTAMLFALSLALVGPRAQAAPPTPPTTPPGQRATPPDTKTTKWVVTSHHVRLQVNVPARKGVIPYTRATSGPEVVDMWVYLQIGLTQINGVWHKTSELAYNYTDTSASRDVPDSIHNSVTLYKGATFIAQNDNYCYSTATCLNPGTGVYSYGDGTYYGFGYVTVYFSQVPTQINFGNSVSG